MGRVYAVFQDPVECVECGGRVIHDGNGLLVCEQCGLVYGRVYDMPLFERRSDAKRRANVAHYYPEKQLKPETALERLLVDVCIRRLGLNLNTTVTALKVYRKIRGHSRKHVVAAIWAACKAHGTYVSLDELKKAVTGRSKISGLFTVVAEAMKHVHAKPEPPRKTALKHVDKICYTLSLSSETHSIAYEIVKKLKHVANPKTVAAAAVYTAALTAEPKRVGQKEIAEAAHVSDVALRLQFYRIIKELTIEVYL